MNRRQFSILLPAAGLLIGCDTEEKPAAVAAVPNNEKVQNAVEKLGSTVVHLEGHVSDFRSGKSWDNVVPAVESATSDIRIAYEHLRQALGLPTV
jgi:hypothetical protein